MREREGKGGYLQGTALLGAERERDMELLLRLAGIAEHSSPCFTPMFGHARGHGRGNVQLQAHAQRQKKRRYPIMAGMSQIDDAAEKMVVVDSLVGRWE